MKDASNAFSSYISSSIQPNKDVYKTIGFDQSEWDSYDDFWVKKNGVMYRVHPIHSVTESVPNDITKINGVPFPKVHVPKGFSNYLSVY